MGNDIEELVAGLYRRGLSTDGIIWVLRLLAAEHEKGSGRRRDLEVAEAALRD